MRRFTTGVLAVVLCSTGLVGTASAQDASDCPDTSDLSVPGAEFFQVTCLEDLTTFSNPRTDETTFGWGGGGSRDNGAVHSEHTEFPEVAVPGIQIEGWFPDSCSRYETEHNTFVPSCAGGFRHNGQFVIRVPNGWDGEHLVVGGTPGIRTQFASDIILSDFALYRGWAYASQDKGNTGLNFFRAGDDETDGSATSWVPPAAIEQWAPAMEAAALAAQGVLEQLHGVQAERTYAAGISNGGYQTRLALERYPELFDGGVDWEGTLFLPEGPNLYTYIPPLLQAYPEYRGTSSEVAYAKLVHEGRVPPDSEPVWDHHYEIYWGSVASTYRPAVDPEYTDGVAAPRLIVPPGDPDAEYDYDERPEFVRERIARIGNTGDIHGKPLITLHGTLDALLPISTDSDVYADLVRSRGHGDSHRYYVIEGGEHVDPSADEHPEVMRPILPCFWDALEALDAWVADGVAPPPNGFVPFPAEQSVEQRANTCGLPTRVGRIAGSDRVDTAIRASRATFGITETVVLATARAFPDALAAAPLAAAHDAPVLLVDRELTEPLRRELRRLGAREALVVGGPAAVPDDVMVQLAGAGLSAVRVAGADRFGTAAAVASRIAEATEEAFVVSGRSFADALAVAPVAAAAGRPILLTEPGTLPPATRQALTDLGVERTVVVGGRAAVADGVVGALPSPERIAGDDRYATSIAVARFALERGHALDEVYLASGRDFPDGLTAGPVAAVGEWGAVPRGVVLLVDGADAARSAPTLAFLREQRGDIGRALLFGGPAAISAAAERAIAATLD